MRIGTSVAVIVLLAGIIAFFALRLRTSEQREADARKKPALESLTERLPRGKPLAPTRPLGAEAKERWEEVDQGLVASQEDRAKLLKELHEKTRKFFVESPGAGPERRLLTPEEILLDGWLDDRTPDQPGKPATFPLSPSATTPRSAICSARFPIRCGAYRA